VSTTVVEIKRNLAGVKLCRTNRLTGRVMTTYLAEAQGIDTDGETYAVVCEEHGAIVGCTQPAGGFRVHGRRRLLRGLPGRAA
jgi:hypothetical protein